MKARTLLFFSLLFLSFACDQANSVYSRFDNDFESSRWMEKDIRTHEFTITDDTKSYDMVLCFSHVYDYEYATIPMVAEITDPSGKTEKIEFDLMIKDSSGKQLADCSGDVCDLEHKIREKAKLEKGNYKVTLSQAFQGPYLPNVIGVGFDVIAAK